MAQLRVTVLIDTYNYGQFIEGAVESVLSQEFPADGMEVLIVDDGSTDDTAKRIERYGRRVNYLYKANGGQASAFNYGIAQARGEIVALLDADDYWLPSKLRRIVSEFDRHPETGMVFHPLIELNVGTNETRQSQFVPLAGYLPDKPSEFMQYFPYQTSCVAFRRETVRKVLPIPERLRVQADGYLGATVVFVAPVLGIPECLGVYRIHGQNLYHDPGGSMTAVRRQERIDMRQGIIDGAEEWLSRNGYDLAQPGVRGFLDRWRLYQQSERFLLRRPGRFEFFRHLSLYNRCYGPYISRRLRVINCLNALGALFTGYKHFYLLGGLEKRAISLLGGQGFGGR